MAAESPGPELDTSAETSTDTASDSLAALAAENRAAIADLDAKMAGHKAKTESGPRPVPDLDELKAEAEAEAVAESVDKAEAGAPDASPAHKLFDQFEGKAPDAKPEPKFYDQDAGKTPEELGRELAAEGKDPETTAAKTLRGRLKADKEREIEAARTRIDDVDLAHGMANIVNEKGYDKAAKKTAKAEEAAAAKEAEAQTARTESAAQAEAIKQKGHEKSEAAMAKAWEDADKFKEGYVKEKSKDVVQDEEIAWDAAHAEKGAREQAMAVEKHLAENPPTSEREQKRQTELAADLRSQGTEAAESAIETSTAERDANDARINAQILEASRQINGFVDATEPKGIHPIGVNDQVTPEMVAKLATDLQRSFKVDMAKEPLDAVYAGARLFGQKFIDTYRQSEEPSMRGIVFVERTDRKTGQLVRLDVVSAPRPEKPTPKPGKYKVGFIAERMYQRKENQWRNAIDVQLTEERHFQANPSETNPFYPGDPKNAQKLAPGASGADSYPAMLQRRGMSAETAQHARKPRRLWFGLFG